MKIHIHTPSYFPQLSGMTYAAHGHAELMSELGAQVTVVTPMTAANASSAYSVGLLNHAVQTFSVAGSGLPWSRLRGDLDEIVEFTASERPDIIISEGWYTVGTALLPKLCKHARHAVLSSHGAAEKGIRTPNPAFMVRSIVYRYFERFKNSQILSCLSAAMVLSQTKDGNRFSDLTQYQERGIATFACPNFSTFAPYQASRLLQKRKILLNIGEMSENKNQLLALQVLKKLPEDYVLEYAFPKSNEYLDRVKSCAQAMKLNGRVSYTEGLNREELEPSYRRASLLLVLSHTEAQPIVAIDAICMGLPFVSTPVGCMRDFKGGFVVPPEQLSNAVLSAHASDATYRQLSAAAVACYVSRYSRDTSLDSVRKMLEILSI